MREKELELDMSNSLEVSKARKAIYFAVKRLFDIVTSLIGIILLVPIYLGVRIAYILSGDLHKIIFVQKRIGKDGKLFKFYKFRTMVIDADDILDDLLKNNPHLKEEYDKNKKLHNDPRITNVGNFIRKHSIDEFPQFVNIFLGQMSLIGNRPYLPREKKDMGAYYHEVIKTKPGLTGYWQVSGRNDVSFHKRLELEKYYSNNYSFKLDLEIFFKTFKVLFNGIGAK